MNCRAHTNSRALIDACQGADRAGTELAAPLRGEGAPVSACTNHQAKAPRSVLAFNVAAALLGHSLATVEGAAAARHDHRVWDTYEALLP